MAGLETKDGGALRVVQAAEQSRRSLLLAQGKSKRSIEAGQFLLPKGSF